MTTGRQNDRQPAKPQEVRARWRGALPLRRGRRGATALTYGLVVGLVAIAGIGAVTRMGDSVGTLFTDVSSTLDGTASPQSRATPTATATASDLGLIDGPTGQGRRWADGSFAASCLSYRRPPAGYSYTGSTGDGVYRVEPSGTGAFDVYCDMATEGGGWSRVASFALGSGYCGFNGAAQNDPVDGGTCDKLSDAQANALASEKVFFFTHNGSAANNTWTRYSGSISHSAAPGQIINGDSYADVASTAPTYTPGYAGWDGWHNHDWYQADTCKGATSATRRLSLEYLSGTYLSPTSNRYLCSACGSCGTSISSGTIHIYMR